MKHLRSINDFSLPDQAFAVIDALESSGFEAWVVGGFVRDSLLGRPCSDIDVATNATWQQVRDIAHAAGMSTYETGVAHGTITVRIDDVSVEVTTYRVDGAYSDARHPDSVSYADSISADLSRRDFTMNALAYSPKRGLLDPFGGSEDMRKGVIVAVGDAPRRFAEDALRILRAIRFASELGFALDDDTRRAADLQAFQLERISAERIASELTRLICGPFARSAIMDYPTILDTALPELAAMRGFDQKSPYHSYDVYEHTSYVVEGVCAQPTVRWAALLHDSGKPASYTVGANGQGHFYGHAKESASIAAEVMARLKMPRSMSQKVVALVRYHDMHQQPSPQSVKRLLRKLDADPDLFRALCELQRADALAHAPGHRERAKLADQMESILEGVLASNDAFRLADLAITGDDIIACGVPEGPEVGDMLEAALDAVVEGTIPNERESLLAYIEGL